MATSWGQVAVEKTLAKSPRAVVDGLPLTGPGRVIVEVRVSWAGHP